MGFRVYDGAYDILNKVVKLNAPSIACCVKSRHKYVQDLRRNIKSEAEQCLS